MNPWIPHLLRASGGGGGPVLPPTGRTMLANLTSSLILDEGTGGPTWSRATKAWGFNELGYLEELASGCAFFGGARLVRNFIRNSALDNATWTNTGLTITTGQTDYLGGTSAFLLMETAATSNHDIRDDAVSPGSGRVMIISVVAKDNGRDQIRITDNAWGTISATFNLSSETAVSTIGTSTITSLGGGYYKCIAKTSGSLANNPFYPRIYIYNGGISYAGDITKGVILSHVQVSSVTNYDTSYVPEYVSVGVESSPYFGAGIDGAKYFETDWQGAPIAAANLLRVRREASAINNLLWSRDLTNDKWVKVSTVGSDLVVNGAFADGSLWVDASTTTGTFSVGSGFATIVGTSPSARGAFKQTDILTIGKPYTVTLTTVRTSGDMYVGGVSVGSGGSAISATGTYTKSFMAEGADLVIYTAGGGGNFTIDDVSVKESAIQPTKTATGLDGIANTATTLTATAADAIILQPISLAYAARCASAYVKRRTGTGTISFTQDGGSTWTDITSLINSSTWSRVEITATLANPSVGFKISTSGDAIDVDCVQNEAGAVATSPIITTTAAVSRGEDSDTYQTASNWSDTAGTAYIEAQPWQWSSGGLLGSATNGLLKSASNSGATAYDGTNAANGPTGTPSGRKKLALRWTGATMDVSVGGVIGTAGTYDGAMGLSSLGIAVNSSGYFGPAAVWNYAMTDDEFKALTT